MRGHDQNDVTNRSRQWDRSSVDPQGRWPLEAANDSLHVQW